MFFRKKEILQRLNLEAPKAEPSLPSHVPSPSRSMPLPTADPSKVDAVIRRAKAILNAGRIPDWLFVCSVSDGLLVFHPPPDQKPAMLIFSSPFAARDYLRSIGMAGTVLQFKVETLSQTAQSWLDSGLEVAIMDRCPRCPEFLSIGLDAMVKWTRGDFAEMWSYFRATRSVLGEIRIRSAMNHLTAGSRAAARMDLEYVRDHFDCGVPYLHQMIGLLAGMQRDEPARNIAMERLKEFGPQFEGPLDCSPQLLATAAVGLLAKALESCRAPDQNDPGRRWRQRETGDGFEEVTAEGACSRTS